MMFDQSLHKDPRLSGRALVIIEPVSLTKAQSAEKRRLKTKIRRKVFAAEKQIRLAVDKWMRKQTEIVMDDYDTAIAKDEAGDFVSTFTDWEEIETLGVSITKPAIANAFGEGGKLSYALVGDMPYPFDPLKRASAEVVDELCAKMVTDVTNETQAAIRVVVRDGIEKGKGWLQIGRELRPKVGLNEQMVKWSASYEEKLWGKGLSERKVYEQLGAYERKLHRMRNETIARTEAARAMNEGQIQGYREAGVETLSWFPLYSACEICADHDGEERPIQVTRGVLPFHPRCRCMWLPVRAA